MKIRKILGYPLAILTYVTVLPAFIFGCIAVTIGDCDYPGITKNEKKIKRSNKR